MVRSSPDPPVIKAAVESSSLASAAETEIASPDALRKPTVPSRSGETLSELGFRLRTDAGVTGAQMAWALYEANPHAFQNRDVNRLMAGARLNVPSRATALQIANRTMLAACCTGSTETQSGTPAGMFPRSWNLRRCAIVAAITPGFRGDANSGEQDVFPIKESREHRAEARSGGRIDCDWSQPNPWETIVYDGERPGFLPGNVAGP